MDNSLCDHVQATLLAFGADALQFDHITVVVVQAENTRSLSKALLDSAGLDHFYGKKQVCGYNGHNQVCSEPSVS